MYFSKINNKCKSNRKYVDIQIRKSREVHSVLENEVKEVKEKTLLSFGLYGSKNVVLYRYPT